MDSTNFIPSLTSTIAVGISHDSDFNLAEIRCSFVDGHILVTLPNGEKFEITVKSI